MQINTPWGPLGFITFARTYARRLKDDDANSATESFEQTVDRVVKSCRKQLKVGFTEAEEVSLKEMLLKLKFSVAGRFWWQLGTKTVDKLGLFSLQNCAFVVVDSPIEPFCWTFDALMLGSGVGYNIQKEFVYELPKPKRVKITRQDTKDANFIVPDSREGWTDLLRKTLEAHFITGKGFTYSTICVRGKGAPIKSFGGVASGPEELCYGINEISRILNDRAGKKVRPIDCLDIMNVIGHVVVSGNVRRSAQIAIGDFDDIQFLRAKRWDLGNVPNYRSMSNNSVVCNDFSLLPEEFWEGYKGNGEPYGLINLKLAQAIGRLGETQYPDPDVRGFNPCVAGETEILTSSGYQRIDSLVDKEVDVWNGFEFSTVTPRITGLNQPMVTVTLSDGRKLRCTKGHKWVLATDYRGGTKRVDAKDLQVGDRLLKTSMPVIEGGDDFENAYTQGFHQADGDTGSKRLWLFEPKFKCLSRLSAVAGAEFELHSGLKRKLSVLSFDPLPKNFVPFSWSLPSKLEWLAGVLDGDGCELKEGGAQISSIDKDFLLNIQKMLTTCGVTSKVGLMRESGVRSLPNGTGGYAEYVCQDSYRICIGATQIQSLKSLGMTCSRLSFDKQPNRDASQFVKVLSVEDSGTERVVYCFTEPKRNLGCFNGVVTGQCAEQSLASFETCCLAEVFLPNIESKGEFFEALKFAYRICKHSLALPCHQEKTEEIVHKNMRMGIGITGQLQATKEQNSWLTDGYAFLRQFDAEYSKANGFNPSIKLTTVKPSGTLSLLAGTTPGCHPGYSQFFIRRIRIASNSNLIKICRDNGYHVEFQKGFDGSEDKNTMVVEFPCRYPKGTVLAADMTAVSQLENIKWLQSNWSDNAVSCTVYYKPEELPEIREWMSANFNNSLKSCSFLLHSEHGFIQAPFEEISEERYNELIAVTKPINGVEIKESDFELDECATGACPIK